MDSFRQLAATGRLRIEFCWHTYEHRDSWAQSQRRNSNPVQRLTAARIGDGVYASFLLRFRRGLDWRGRVENNREKGVDRVVMNAIGAYGRGADSSSEIDTANGVAGE